jgi:hypothetical protein
MALKKCKECGNQVSTKAGSCPNCGAVLKAKTSGWDGCLALLVVGFIVLGVIEYVTDSGSFSRSSGSSTKTEAKPKTPEEQRKERIEKGFRAWDGSHYGLTKIIKASMNDPDSYKHAETAYWDMKDHLIVRTTFRGKNAFGGVVSNWVKAKCDLDGNVIEVLEQGP